MRDRIGVISWRMGTDPDSGMIVVVVVLPYEITEGKVKSASSLRSTRDDSTV
jgi:hypothetical protein